MGKGGQWSEIVGKLKIPSPIFFNTVGSHGKAWEALLWDYESSERIGMMHTNRLDYLPTLHAQVAVSYSNSSAC
jgi:hypothetical protein